MSFARKLTDESDISEAEAERRFDSHRMSGCLPLHNTTSIMVSVWAISYAFLYQRELQLVGTLWPIVYTIKLTLYTTIVAMHGSLRLAYREAEARYVFGALGSLHVDTAHQLACICSAVRTRTLSLPS